MRLEDKVAVVTGAGRGIGRAIALAMAKEGAKVVVSDVKEENCKNVLGEIEGAGGKGLALKCDVSSKSDIDNTVKRAIEEFGRLDILVNNAGILNFKPFLGLSEEDWDRTLSINLKGQFLCAQAASNEMVKNRWGRIINIASISHGGCGIAFPEIAHYTASKGGVVALTEALALELTPKGINCNAICPGAVDTEMTKDIKEGGQLEQVLMRIPKGRMAKPEEIANLAVFLASEDAEYISGSSIVIDGGWLTS
jgi:NAD(P)-dependent dehydrogenase (short-subunit alcohol dehydrogenase family)